MDTLVSTENGLRPIEEIQAGDYVWSENTETGKKELKKVLSVSVTETTPLVNVTTENGTVINTTENHPFYVEGKGWCAAAELEAGDVLWTEDGEQETVKSVQTEKLDKAVKVYNLEIEGSHTYYVSADSVLVHNECNIIGGGHGSNQHRDAINSKITELAIDPDCTDIWKNRALNTVGLKEKQRPDIIALFKINEKTIYRIFEYDSKSQADGKQRQDLINKINIMKRNNPSLPEEKIFIEFSDLIEWGDY